MALALRAAPAWQQKRRQAARPAAALRRAQPRCAAGAAAAAHAHAAAAAAAAFELAEDPLNGPVGYSLLAASVAITSYVWVRGTQRRYEFQEELLATGKVPEAKKITRIGALRFLKEKNDAGKLTRKDVDKVLSYQRVWDTASGARPIEYKAKK